MSASTAQQLIRGRENGATTRFSARSAASFTLFACALFIVLGVVTTLLGPILPLLSSRWPVTTAQLGSLFFWQFIPSTIGTLLSGAAFAKRSFRLGVVLGVALCLLGVCGLIWADWNLGRAAVACYGVGLGIALPAINLAVAEANQARRAAAVSLVNFAWGLGAISGPLLLRLTHSLSGFLAALSVLVALGLAASAFWEMPPKTNAVSPDQPTTPTPGSIWILAPLIAISMFLFCGVENAVAGWATTLALPSFADAFRATNANEAFWAFFLTGRALAPFALRRMSEGKLLLVSIITAAAGVLAFYLAAHAPTILLACAITGLGVGPGFPLLISRVSELIGPERPACTVCFAFAGIGAATLPSAMGVIGERVGDPRAGLLLPLAGLVLLLPTAKMLSAWGRQQLSNGSQV
ncbi:MAG TPA: MFS transporter [Terriglobales bacterium]|nr:MFS transporter [Terriglobales bacterium]